MHPRPMRPTSIPLRPSGRRSMATHATAPYDRVAARRGLIGAWTARDSAGGTRGGRSWRCRRTPWIVVRVQRIGLHRNGKRVSGRRYGSCMSTASAVVVADRANRKIGAAQLELLLAILDVERDDAWLDDGARDLAHWVSMRYGVSHWKACRWVGAARSFEAMPALGFALREGVLSIDKVVELARFATPDTIDGLTRWAEDVSAGAIRRRADVEIRRERDEAADVECSRML